MTQTEPQHQECQCPCHRAGGSAIHAVPCCHRPFGPVRNLLKSYLLTLAIPVRKTRQRFVN